MLINEIILEAPEPWEDKTKADIPDEAKVTAGSGRQFIWSQERGQWYDTIERYFVRSGTSLDRGLFKRYWKIPSRTKDLSLNPFKLIAKGVSKAVNKMVPDVNYGKGDDKMPLSKKAAGWVGGAIGRGLDNQYRKGKEAGQRYSQKLKQKELDLGSDPLEKRLGMVFSSLSVGDEVVYWLRKAKAPTKYKVSKIFKDPSSFGGYQIQVQKPRGGIFVVDNKFLISTSPKDGSTGMILNRGLYDKAKLWAQQNKKQANQTYYKGQQNKKGQTKAA